MNQPWDLRWLRALLQHCVFNNGKTLLKNYHSRILHKKSILTPHIRLIIETHITSAWSQQRVVRAKFLSKFSVAVACCTSVMILLPRSLWLFLSFFFLSFLVLQRRRTSGGKEKTLFRLKNLSFIKISGQVGIWRRKIPLRGKTSASD